MSVRVLTPMLRDRKLSLVIVAAGAVQIGFTSLGLPGWQCPFLQVCGIPCPGCGLTRATVLLLKGDWRNSVTFHAFAPIFVIAFALLVIAAVAPERSRRRVIEITDAIERRTGMTAIILVGLIVYWLGRLLIMQSAFVNLIKG